MAGTKGLAAVLLPVGGELPLDACAEEPDICGTGEVVDFEELMDKCAARRVGDQSFCNQSDREPSGLIICSEMSHAQSEEMKTMTLPE